MAQEDLALSFVQGIAAIAYSCYIALQLTRPVTREGRAVRVVRGAAVGRASELLVSAETGATAPGRECPKGAPKARLAARLPRMAARQSQQLRRRQRFLFAMGAGEGTEEERQHGRREGNGGEGVLSHSSVDFQHALASPGN